MANPIPPSPGDYIKAALSERGWTQADLALILNRHVPAVNELIQGKRQLTPEVAVELAVAFGTTPQLWLEREAEYRLALVAPVGQEVHSRVKLMDLAPVKEMEKRGWIRPTNDVRDLESELCKFFNQSSLEEEPKISAAARQTFKCDEFTAAQRAWIFRAAHLAAVLNVRPFSPAAFEAGLSEVHALASSAEKIHNVPRVLAELGVRLVIVEPLPRSRIDGAAFWLDDDSSSPVVVLSVRFDRIDGFWHTLAHELSHIRNGDKRSVDSDLIGESRIESLDEMEARADREATEFLIPEEKMKSFILRMRPFYSKVRIQQFAQRMGVHPGIVNGRLQHLKEVNWSANREMLVKIRNLVTTTAITDGWGRSVMLK